MPRPKRIDGRVVWDRLKIDAAFSDLPDEARTNPLDRMLELSPFPFDQSRSVCMSSRIETRTDDILAGWEMSVTMQLRTPLKWLVRHREFHEGHHKPRERLPTQYACWVPVTKSWRALGIDEDDLPESTMASEIGQIPVDGGTWLPFLLEYRMIIEDGGGTLEDIASRYPQHRHLLFPTRPKGRSR